ncbi:MAG TPA: hypothetical protein VGD50_03050 [Candidatus Baltobacteraceae bacterium]
MPRSFIPTLILVVLIGGAISGWFLFSRGEIDRYRGAQAVLRAPSDIRLGLSVQTSKGRIGQEEYRMEDFNGVSTAVYRAVGRDGRVIRVESRPHETYDVSFLFEKAVQDGIWELRSKPPRGDISTEYTITVYQLNDYQHGSHTFTFTDPHYWATTGGRQYHIRLDRNKPVPDLLQLQSTVLMEPRYQALLDDFRTFGSSAFRSTVAGAQARLQKPT